MIPKKLAKAIIVSDPTRALLDVDLYQNFNKPIILPLHHIGNIIKNKIKDLMILDYALILDKNSFKISSKSCKIKWSLAFAYALAIITQAQAKNISLVGFDGYSKGDIKNNEMDEVLSRYKKLSKSLNIISLTPTLYKIKRKHNLI